LIGDLLVAVEMQLFKIADAVDLSAGHAGLIDETTGRVGAQAIACVDNLALIRRADFLAGRRGRAGERC
jgi:hypothetical protein